VYFFQNAYFFEQIINADATDIHPNHYESKGCWKLMNFLVYYR